MKKLDILNRDKFIDDLLRIMENISDNKASTCFALNGIWGSGKSFVLDMFEEKLSAIQSEETYTDKYFIVRYNSWQYDYYEEPLVAIVATMMSAIEEKTKLFPDSEEKQEMLGMLKAAGVSLLSLGNTFVKEKTGIDFQQAYETILNGEKNGAQAYADKHEYDVYFGFNKVMGQLTTLLRNLADKYVVVIIVDELDRCLPEYAIKVLERLHHLTENSANTITIVAIDKVQLLSSVKQIFGFDNPDRYLEKFINFEIKLDNGETSEKIVEKYSSYIDLFDKEIFLFDESVEECLQNIFKDIDIRTQEQIVKKVMLTHKLLYSDKKDYSFMCMELILAVMLFVYDDGVSFLEKTIDVNNLENVFATSKGKNKPAFSAFFKEKFEQISFTSRRNFSDEPRSYILPNKSSLYGAIIFTWYWMHEKNKNTVIQHTDGDSYDVIARNYEELKKFVETINMMR